MKKLIVGAVLALAVSAFLPRAASADLQWNGIRLNGITLQGVKFNGISLNGPVLQGVKLNGIRLNGPGLVVQGTKFNGIRLNGPGLVLQGVKLNGISLKGPVTEGLTFDGALFQGGERPAPQCTAAGVDFSAVPLAKVTVRLPQQVR
jgi:uncharacterized protein YjbI with pentapeptide repeats